MKKLELLGYSVNSLIQPQWTIRKSFQHILKIYHACANGIVLGHKVRDYWSDFVIDAWLVSSKQLATMDDGTPDDTLFGNSGTFDFNKWRAANHVLYFSEAKIVIWSSTESFLVWKSWGISSLLENLPYLTKFWQFKMYSSDLLLDDALHGCLLISRQNLLQCHMHFERALK